MHFTKLLVEHPIESAALFFSVLSLLWNWKNQSKINGITKLSESPFLTAHSLKKDKLCHCLSGYSDKSAGQRYVNILSLNNDSDTQIRSVKIYSRDKDTTFYISLNRNSTTTGNILYSINDDIKTGTPLKFTITYEMRSGYRGKQTYLTKYGEKYLKRIKPKSI